MSDSAAIYCCPGETQPISRAVHLGRLARFYPPCRTCRHRDETGSLSPQQVEQLLETRRRAPVVDPFNSEGLAGVEPNDLNSAVARRAAIAFASRLHTRQQAGGAPRVVAGWDGPPKTVELFEAAMEGLRLAGCDTVDVGPVIGAGLNFALNSLQAAGGLLVGNPLGEAHTAGLKFWQSEGRPLSAGAGLDEMRERFHAGTDERAASYGALRRHQAETGYLAELQPYFHALRPLRVAVQSSSLPLVRCLKLLSAQVACRFHLHGEEDVSRGEPGCNALAFRVWIDGDGEVCRFSDERERPLPGDQLLVVFARHLLQDRGPACVVIEEGTPAATEHALRAAGAVPVRSAATRAAMHEAMRAGGAVAGGGPSGRFWFASPLPAADALRALALLLVVLSQSDRPLSLVAATAILSA